MSRSLKRSSEKYKQKVLGRWRSMLAHGVSLEQAALEIGVRVADLRAWSRDEALASLVVPVQIDAATVETRGLVVVLAGGVRVEGLTLEDVVELARRLS